MLSTVSTTHRPGTVLVLRQLADEFGAVGVQAGEDVLDVFDGERNAAAGGKGMQERSTISEPVSLRAVPFLRTTGFDVAGAEA